MLYNELYRENTKPVAGKMPEAGKPAGDNAMRNDVDEKPEAGQEQEDGKTAGGNVMKNDGAAKPEAGQEQEAGQAPRAAKPAVG